MFKIFALWILQRIALIQQGNLLIWKIKVLLLHNDRTQAHGEPHCCFHFKKCQYQWEITFVVTLMTSGTAEQLVPAQEAQSKVDFCRERQNLALPEGFLLPKGKPKMHCTVGFWHSFSGSNYFELFLKLWPCLSDWVSVEWDAFFDILLCDKSLTFTQEKTFFKFKNLQAFAVKKEIPEPVPSGKPLRHCF